MSIPIGFASHQPWNGSACGWNFLQLAFKGAFLFKIFNEILHREKQSQKKNLVHYLLKVHSIFWDLFLEESCSDGRKNNVYHFRIPFNIVFVVWIPSRWYLFTISRQRVRSHQQRLRLSPHLSLTRHSLWAAITQIPHRMLPLRRPCLNLLDRIFVFNMYGQIHMCKWENSERTVRACIHF